VSVAVIRTAAIHRRELFSENPETAPTIQRVLSEAFAELAISIASSTPRSQDA
jgi:hypothetical protein